MRFRKQKFTSLRKFPKLTRLTRFPAKVIETAIAVKES